MVSLWSEGDDLKGQVRTDGQWSSRRSDCHGYHNDPSDLSRTVVS